MDHQRIGAVLRVLRLRRGLRQVDVARLAGVSDQTISRVERGQLDSLSVAVISRVTRVLEARLELGVWSRAGDIERVASAQHAALVEALIGVLVDAGWTAHPEVSFNLNGERGAIDVLAWHAATQSLLVIEAKTEIVDVGEALGTFDRKRRLAASIGHRLGYEALTVACALVVADTRTNHRRVAEHAATLTAAFPDGGLRFRSFVRQPAGSIAALAFLPIRHPGSARHQPGGVRRVRRPGAPSGRGSSTPRGNGSSVLTGE